ncbi:MAG: ribulokinase [Phycisphaerales bacterium]|nr:ribulokinase [Phycisphaerales bacterium]
MSSNYVIGLDFGSSSVRALLVDAANGRELAEQSFDYPHGRYGVILDKKNPNLARQHPADYLLGIKRTIRGVLNKALQTRGFSRDRVIGIGVDTTGSTPMPVDTAGTPLVMLPKFRNNRAALAWLWKDHTSHVEAAEITELGRMMRPHYMAKIGGRYSSEWFWAKILHCARTSPEVFEAAATWVELADFVPAQLTGNVRPEQIRRGVCAAGHKALFSHEWGGYADDEFLGKLDPRLVKVRGSLPSQVFNVSAMAGRLTSTWAAKLGLTENIPVAIGAFDCHLGAIGAGISDNTLVKIMGTSTCDIMVAPIDKGLTDIPGLCGIVPESVLPGYFGLEAGQSAVGDIFDWFVNRIAPGGHIGSYESLTRIAGKLKPGASGLLALDWHNGNRTVLVDQRLTGAILGLTLYSTPAEIYRSLIEATAFGSRVIMERLEEYGVRCERVINCGGIAAKNPLIMQIYADVLGRPISISRSSQTCALGSAIAAAVVSGVHSNFSEAIASMTGVQKQAYKPKPSHVAVYNRLYRQYRVLHDAFGAGEGEIAGVMKNLLIIRDEVRQ